jgi:hypothetical protein
MGTSHGDFTKYPRTPHLFGSKGTDDDKHLGEAESRVRPGLLMPKNVKQSA